ncbi:MAG: hypothetical protein V2I63_10770 [Pseudomonadales bacterium]|jgi:lauroyl/myristoyl acyltransferase|nr:hypothetical protein [Pseudomonadales bacterium]
MPLAPPTPEVAAQLHAIAFALGCGPRGARRILRQTIRANARFRRDYVRLARASRVRPHPPAWPEQSHFEALVRSDGRPLVLATLHLGNYLSNLLALAGPLAWLRRVTVIRRERGNPLEAPMLAHFARQGLELRVERSRDHPARAALRALRRGDHLLLLYDVPPSFDVGRTVEVPFFGATGHFPAGPAALAAAGNALLWPMALRGDRVLRLEAHPLMTPGHGLGIDAATRHLARFAETQILADPDAWLLWGHVAGFWHPRGALQPREAAPDR